MEVGSNSRRVKMAEKASAKHCSSNEEYSSSQPLLVPGDKSQVEIEVMQDKTGQSYIEVTCGDVSGGLYLEKLKRVPHGRALEKCIWCNNGLYTPQEFESMGGKKASKAWRKTIKHKGIPLQKLLASGVLKEQESMTQFEAQQQSDEALLDPPRANPVDMDEMFEELVNKSSKTIEEAVKSAVSALKSTIEKEMEYLTKRVDNLTARVIELETSGHPTTEKPPERQMENQPSIEQTTQAIQTQIKQLENSVSNHQRLLEKKERESRENNMVVFGIEEKLDSEERENTLDLINEFLESKLKTTSIKAVQA